MSECVFCAQPLTSRQGVLYARQAAAGQLHLEDTCPARGQGGHTDLTPAQGRLLAAVRAAGTKTYNGRARSMIDRLEKLGLVDVDWDMDLVTKGGGLQARWRITVVPKEQKR